MNKKEVKQILLTVSFNKIKDLILADKTDEAQAALEMLTAQLKEIDNSCREKISLEAGDFVTLDDPKHREIIDINSYRDVGYLNNVYVITSIDKNYHIHLSAIKNRDGASGYEITLSREEEVERITKLNIKSPSVKSNLGINW
jgi:hypothetical protein